MNEGLSDTTNTGDPQINPRDLPFLIAAAQFAHKYDVVTRVTSESNFTQKIPDLMLQAIKSANSTEILRTAAELECAIDSNLAAADSYTAELAGYASNLDNMKRALEARDAIAARKAFQERALFLLKFNEFRSLNSPMTTALVVRACETNDFNFIQQLGRRLSQKPRAISEIEPERIRSLLTTFWIDDRFGAPLCRLTDEALFDFCRLALDLRNLSSSGVSFDQVRQIRKRFKLKKGPRPHFKTVQSDGKTIRIS